MGNGPGSWGMKDMVGCWLGLNVCACVVVREGMWGVGQGFGRTPACTNHQTPPHQSYFRKPLLSCGWPGWPPGCCDCWGGGLGHCPSAAFWDIQLRKPWPVAPAWPPPPALAWPPPAPPPADGWLPNPWLKFCCNTSARHVSPPSDPQTPSPAQISSSRRPVRAVGGGVTEGVVVVVDDFLPHQLRPGRRRSFHSPAPAGSAGCRSNPILLDWGRRPPVPGSSVALLGSAPVLVDCSSADSSPVAPDPLYLFNTQTTTCYSSFKCRPPASTDQGVYQFIYIYTISNTLANKKHHIKNYPQYKSLTSNSSLSIKKTQLYLHTSTVRVRNTFK